VATRRLDLPDLEEEAVVVVAKAEPHRKALKLPHRLGKQVNRLLLRNPDKVEAEAVVVDSISACR
jgi:hypothetical protein